MKGVEQAQKHSVQSHAALAVLRREAAITIPVLGIGTRVEYSTGARKIPAHTATLIHVVCANVFPIYTISWDAVIRIPVLGLWTDTRVESTTGTRKIRAGTMTFSLNVCFTAVKLESVSSEVQVLVLCWFCDTVVSVPHA